jgi:hypothetical protein
MSLTLYAGHPLFKLANFAEPGQWKLDSAPILENPRAFL